MTDFCQLWLTCKDEAEADKVGKALLRKRLIACYGKINDYHGEYWWKGKIQPNNETFLEMLSREDLFEDIEAEVQKLHSYDTPSLLLTPVKRVSKGVAEWLGQELKNAK